MHEKKKENHGHYLISVKQRYVTQRMKTRTKNSWLKTILYSFRSLAFVELTLFVFFKWHFGSQVILHITNEKKCCYWQQRRRCQHWCGFLLQPIFFIGQFKNECKSFSYAIIFLSSPTRNAIHVSAVLTFELTILSFWFIQNRNSMFKSLTKKPKMKTNETEQRTILKKKRWCEPRKTYCY